MPLEEGQTLWELAAAGLNYERLYVLNSLGCDTQLWTMVKEHLLRSDVICEAWTIAIVKVGSAFRDSQTGLLGLNLLREHRTAYPVRRLLAAI